MRCGGKNMFLDIILILIIIIAVGIILFIIFKKLPQLTRVEPEKTSLFKEDQMKKEILEKKFKRDLNKYGQKTIKFLKPIFILSSKYVKKGYEYLYQLEEKHRKKLIKTHFEDKISIENEILKYLENAEKFIEKKEWMKAENEYINALKIDIHNLDIYKKLADLYFNNKEYNKAKETYEYIIKLSPQSGIPFTGKDDDYVYNKLGDISSNRGDLNQAFLNYTKSIELKNDNPIYYYNLAEINLKLDKWEESLNNIKKALNIESENPKLLDFLLDLSIIMGDRELANKTLNKLIEVNPENQKILEARERINQI